VRKPQKGCSSRPSWSTTERVGRSGRRSTLWGAAARAKARSGKRVRGGEAKSLPRRTWQTLEGENPGEHPARGALTTRAVARDSREVETQELRLGEPAPVSAWVYRQAKQ
jgi:hypothetical protein